MALADAQLLEVVYVNRMLQQSGLMVRHYLVTETVGTISEQVAADELSAIMSDFIKDCMSSDASYRGLTLQKIDPPPASDRFISTQGQGPGAAASPVMSTQTAGVISLRTGIAGRRNRGRTYVPFPSEGANEANGKPNATYLVDLGALGTQLAGVQVIAPGGGNSCNLVPQVYSRTFDSFRTISSYLVRTEWGTQRRRSQINRGDLPPVP